MKKAMSSDSQTAVWQFSGEKEKHKKVRRNLRSIELSISLSVKNQQEKVLYI